MQQVKVEAVLAALEKVGSTKVRDGYLRYGIVADKAYGVPMAVIQKLAKGYGKDHALATALWDTGVYEARMMAAYIGEPARVTPAQMDRWAKQFDNWAVCDTLCFALWDRTPHAFAKIHAWAAREDEWVKRAAFALLAGVALHDKGPIDAELEQTLPLCEAAATDGRNFVKKGVSWALRTIGTRDHALHAKVTALATKLAKRDDAPSRWLGKDVLRDLERPLVAKRLAVKAAKGEKKKKPRAASSRGTR